MSLSEWSMLSRFLMVEKLSGSNRQRYVWGSRINLRKSEKICGQKGTVRVN